MLPIRQHERSPVVFHPNDAPLFERLDPILTRHQLAPAALEERDQMLYLRLENRLSWPTARYASLLTTGSAGFSYIALDPIHCPHEKRNSQIRRRFAAEMLVISEVDEDVAV